MMQGNARSKIVHYANCFHNKRMAEHNAVEIESIDVAKSMGYRVCKCCTPVLKAVRREAIHLKDYCSNHDIKYSVEDNKVKISGPDSEWIYTINCENKATLYHKNTCGDTNAYHVQKYRGKSILSTLKYIVEHDAYRRENPVEATPKVTKKYTDPFRYFFSQSSQPVTEKAPLIKDGNWVRIKGTKKYNKKVRREKEKKRKAGIRTVLALIDGLSAAY